jgi:hypothetical protein
MIGGWRLMETGTHHNESRMGARSLARELWAIYSELVRAGFREDQSLALLLKLIALGEK